MRKLVAALLIIGMVTVAGASVNMQFGFDNNASDRGIGVDGTQQTIDFSGGYTANGETDFNNLDGVNSAVNFSVSGLDIGTFSGTITPAGGDFNMGASGGGIDATGSDSAYFDSDTESWTFTFNNDLTLTDVNYYAPDSGQQTILVDGTAVTGSPFSDDLSGESISVASGDTLKFGYDSSGTGTYGIDTFTIDAIPEPTTFTLVALLSAATLLRRKLFQS